MKFFVYILRSQKDGKRYIGMTGYLKLRIAEHEKGLVQSTRNRRPLHLIYQEECVTKKEAEKRELFFKSGAGREYLKTIGL